MKPRFEMAIVLAWLSTAGTKGISKKELNNDLHISESDVDDVIHHLQKDGHVRVEGGDRIVAKAQPTPKLG